MFHRLMNNPAWLPVCLKVCRHVTYTHCKESIAICCLHYG